MDYLQLIPTELIEITISFLEYADLINFTTLIPYPNLINWSTIHIYHFGSYTNVNKDKYMSYLTIESLKNKLNPYTDCISLLSQEEIYNLVRLDLSHKQLNSIPAEIGNLINLQKLYLFNNKLISIPTEISKLTNLRLLDLSHNQLISIPTEISKLKNLQLLDLSYNQLISIPAEISKLINLRLLDLHGNKLDINQVPINLKHITYFYYH